MSEAETSVAKLIQRLDEAVPRDGAAVATSDMFPFDQSGMFTVIRGNELGLMRLGIELLRAAQAPYTRPEAFVVDVDTSYLRVESQRHAPFRFERTDDPAEDTPGRRRIALPRWAAYVHYAFNLCRFLLWLGSWIFTVIGLGVAVYWVYGHLKGSN
jgi:hypothetical protein